MLILGSGLFKKVSGLKELSLCYILIFANTYIFATLYASLDVVQLVISCLAFLAINYTLLALEPSFGWKLYL